MANYLAQFQAIKSSSDRVVIAVEDVNDLWPLVQKGFEGRLPLKKTYLNSKTRNSVLVENLAAEFILTTDPRLRSRFPQEQSLFWFREPYATVVLVTCEDLDEFKNILKPRLKLIVQNDEREWFIVFVSKALPSNDQATKLVKKVYARLEVDFNTKKRERCCKLELHGAEESMWEDLDSKILECIRNTLDRRVQVYEEEVRKHSEQRYAATWNFCNFFILKESLAFMFEMTHLYEDSLREYDELELCYLETVNSPSIKQKGFGPFGGLEQGDDQAMLLRPECKPLTRIVQEDSFREFEFRQYLFACQSKLLFKLSRPFEVAARGYDFIISFSKALSTHENILPFCLREVWIVTASLALINSTASKYDGGKVAPDVQKEFHRLQGDLYALSREKFMRLAYLIGLGPAIEKTPANSATLSMLPWPKPAVWPAVPSDASSELFAKEKAMLQENLKIKHFGIQRKALPLEPSLLLREANRRRASLSAGNVSELVDNRQFLDDGSGSDNNPHMSRTYSSPGNVQGTGSPLDRPMRLSEIYIAAEHALHQTITDSDLLRSLSSVEEFEQKYMELTKGAADNYHRSWWKRHGVVLDGEIASIYFRRGNYDLAAKLYEKVRALYAGEGWQDLLADMLPNLSECQKILNDEVGYLSSCVKLLSLENCLFLTKERQAIQSEIVQLAHSEMKNPVPLDVSSLITFSGNPGPPCELCDGDPGTLSVAVWSGFPDSITLDSLSLTLIATYSADEGVKGIKCPDALVLKPGKNVITLPLPPQKPGSYVLGVLTGQIGHLRFRSHSFSKGGPPESDDVMTYEKPTKPVLKVLKPRPLVDISAAVSSALLMNELQWVGLVVKPLNYSLKGSLLHVDTGPELEIDETNMVEIESYSRAIQDASNMTHTSNSSKIYASPDGDFKQLHLVDGKIELPDWTSDSASIVWFPVHAIDKKMARGTSAAQPQKQSVVDGMRTVALKLEFGASRNQKFERTIAVHFTDPFYVSTRLVDKGNDGTLLLQIILHSQVRASIKVNDVWLDLQKGFLHSRKEDGRPISNLFPVFISPSSRAALLFSLCLDSLSDADEVDAAILDSILNIRYEVFGSRSIGAHTPFIESSDENKKDLFYKSALSLQRPVLDPSLSVGFLPIPFDILRVGQLFNMNWRVERLKSMEESPSSKEDQNMLYQVEANPENWMIAGRKRGHVPLSSISGSRAVVMVSCMPLVSGYVHPPQLRLPGVSDATIRCNPPAPHLVCVLPPALSSSYCIPA